jgi:hypothetical protein
MPGVYRIRRRGQRDLAQIGQKGGMTVRKRIAMLKGVYGPEMPYRDPHTAAPALWALVQLGDVEAIARKRGNPAALTAIGEPAPTPGDNGAMNAGTRAFRDWVAAVQRDRLHPEGTLGLCDLANQR